MKRCPLHGPVTDEDATTCPVKLRHQIDGECGQALMDDDE
jgi:hypothetical protein